MSDDLKIWQQVGGIIEGGRKTTRIETFPQKGMFLPQVVTAAVLGAGDRLRVSRLFVNGVQAELEVREGPDDPPCTYRVKSPPQDRRNGLTFDVELEEATDQSVMVQLFGTIVENGSPS